jgi:hypothetical protein
MNTEPTWSWASFGKMGIQFKGPEPQSTYLVTKGAEILKASCVPQYGNYPNGQVKARVLVIRGSIKRLTLYCSSAFFSQGLPVEKGAWHRLEDQPLVGRCGQDTRPVSWTYPEL